MSRKTPGVHNTDESFSFPQNERIIIHDSQASNQGAFDDQLRAIWVYMDVVIKKIADIIMDDSVKPEQWAMTEEVFDDSWMPIEALWEP
ncbi:hypothetical protein B0H14DRAFT_3493299 [Mycena olivaceomarginata]|nr:hypothetical protein B0H14DRAFT_3493299 [Mycena olivaceomarginata]